MRELEMELLNLVLLLSTFNFGISATLPNLSPIAPILAPLSTLCEGASQPVLQLIFNQLEGGALAGQEIDLAGFKFQDVGCGTNANQDFQVITLRDGTRIIRIGSQKDGIGLLITGDQYRPPVLVLIPSTTDICASLKDLNSSPTALLNGVTVRALPEEFNNIDPTCLCQVDFPTESFPNNIDL